MIATSYTIPEITAQLEKIRDTIIADIDKMPDERFFEGTPERWSAADYLKHLILSVKPFAKGLTLPREKLIDMFGRSEAPSRSYEEFIAVYDNMLAAGARAEMVPNVVPTGYRIPDGVTDERAYLLDTWRDANQRLFTALEVWTETDLDQFQLPHPAIGMATMREMLYFTMHHNRMHGRDIAQRGESN